MCKKDEYKKTKTTAMCKNGKVQSLQHTFGKIFTWA